MRFATPIIVIIKMSKRLKNIFFVLLAMCYVPLRGNAQKKTKFKKFIIIYPTNNIGDMVCATPIFSAIKKNIPDAHITVVGSSINMALLSQHPFVDAYILATQPAWSLIWKLRTERFDAGIVINPDALNIAKLFLGKVHTISAITLIGKHKQSLTRPFRIISRFVCLIPHIPGTYIPANLLQLLIPFGIIASEPQKLLGYSNASQKEIERMLGEAGISLDKFIAIAPGAGSDIKRWPAKRYASIAEYIYTQYNIPCIIIGGPHDKKAIAEFLNELDSSVHFYNPGPLSMEQLKVLLGRATLLIGNDSGAVHVAQAVGTKTIAIVGATDDGEHLRQSTHHKVVRATTDTQGLYQAYVGNEEKMDITRAREQMSAVTVKMVIETVQDLLT